MTKLRFFASKEERGVWSVWDRESGWWARTENGPARWMKKREAEDLARTLNQSHG